MARPRVVAPLLCLALLSACGSTVPLAQRLNLQSGDGLGGPVSATTAPTTLSGSPLAAGSAAVSGNAAAPLQQATNPHTGTISTQGSTAAGSTNASTPTVSALPAVKGAHTSVEVGFFVVKDLGAATKALGAQISTGDGKTQALASVALLNARGGLAGHQVKPVFYEYDATGNEATEVQAACSTFFQDNKVRAVVAAALLASLRACTAQAGVPFISSSNRTTSASELARYPLTAVPSQISLDRMVPSWIASLNAQGYFAKGSRVGLIYNDDSDYAGVPGLVTNALSSVGAKLIDSQSMPGVDDTSRAPAAASSGQSAVLKFSSDRIDRVLVLDKSGQAIAYFGLAAQTQGYYPVYGISSLDLPNSLRSVLSARSMQGARGIGWSPGLDLSVADQPVVSSNFSACISAMTKAGQDMTSGATRFSALSECEGTLFLGAAWTDPALNPRTFVADLHALGTRFPPALTFGTDFTHRVDGASRFKAIAYQAGCDCFRYSGAFQTAS